MVIHYPFPSIGQFRNIVHDILHDSNKIGVAENGEFIYDKSRVKPVLKFKGTVKLHGTNAAVTYNELDGLWVQSRDKIITPEQDNAGFAKFVAARESDFLELVEKVYADNHLSAKDYDVVIFGEWAGGNIQQGVALTNLEKSFFIFAVQIVKHDEDSTSKWVASASLSSVDNRIFNVEAYPTYEVDIDFNNPQMVQNGLIEITEAVEKECPVAKAFGHTGIGEGVVWTAEYAGTVYRFKVKGSEHSVSKVTKLAAVDTEKLAGIQAFVAYAVTEARLTQAIEKVFGSEPLDQKRTGDLIRWMQGDIVKEESDTLTENGLDQKAVAPKIADATRHLFFKRLSS